MKMLTDNPLLAMKLSLSTLCNIPALSTETPILPHQAPLLIGVEEVRGKDTPPTSPPEAYRYTLAFPGSGFMRVPVKVEEPKPSITPEELESRGPMKVVIEGFSSGCFLTDDGGAKPYFKAKKISPEPAPGATSTAKS